MMVRIPSQYRIKYPISFSLKPMKTKTPNFTSSFGCKIECYSFKNRSKYRQPISDMPSESNKPFADALREIFGK